jgi:hypothetical protein
MVLEETCVMQNLNKPCNTGESAVNITFKVHNPGTSRWFDVSEFMLANALTHPMVALP